jgi:hypothetical protein
MDGKSDSQYFIEKSRKPNTESIPRHRHIKKNTMVRNLVPPMRPRRPGKATKSRSGPDWDSYSMGMSLT